MEKIIEKNIEVVFSLSEKYKDYQKKEDLQQIAIAVMVRTISLNGEKENLKEILKKDIEEELLTFILLQKIEEIKIPFFSKWKERAKSLAKELALTEKKVLLYLFVDEKSPKEVAYLVGISEKDVRGIEEKCFEKIKN